MRIVDLFSGAGGLTFGFNYDLVDGEFRRRDNMEHVFANEYDPNAVNAFRKNYPHINMIKGDIRNITVEQINEYVAGQEVDVIIGGPPCQSFSTIGQRNYDERAKLSEEYLRILDTIRPKMFLFENVKGILSMREIFYRYDENGQIMYEEEIRTRGNRTRVKKIPIIEGYGELIMDKLRDKFHEMGYTIRFETLNAYKFGVPQNRERVVIIGVRDDLNLEWNFPEEVENNLTIQDAISDLPVVLEGQKVTEYTVAPQNDYQELMRNGSNEITEHFCGVYGDKIRTVIHNVAEGEGKEDFNEKVKAGLVPDEYYLTSGYGNTYGRLERNKPAPTMTNNLSTPSSSRCIHYEQHRALTPREGARIQSFPDWFQFDGNRTQVARQIGNAVPPLMAIALANKIIETLDR